VQGLLSLRLTDRTLLCICAHKTAKGQWDQLIEEFGQPGYKDTNKGLTREVPIQTTGVELEVTSGEPDTTKGVAHAHNNCMEMDLQTGQPGDLNANTLEGVTHLELDSMLEEINLNASTHLEGMGPEALMDAEEDCLLEVEEDGTTGKTISVEGDIGPCIEL